MCECITTIPEDLKNNSNEINGKKILEVNLKFVSYPFVAGEFYSALQIPFEFKLEDRKTKLTEKIFARYCPFCGEEYDYSRASKEKKQ